MKSFFYDFDGVMTNNKAYLNQDGIESVQIHRGDGLAVREIAKLGLLQIIVSTEANQVVSQRAKKLGIPCLQDISDKKKSVIKFCIENNLSLSSIAFVGNDINDKDIMQEASLSICPADAHSSIRQISDIVLKTKGGDGVIREILDLILQNKIITR
jgi:YrbI family 3-deoxy-D-manno-octulosonate 8-phosphate phosphatase